MSSSKSAPVSNASNHTNGGNFIGQRMSSGSTGSFPGIIDDIGIWNEALTSNEITALYNAGIPLTATSNSGNYTSSSNLKAYYE